MNFLAVKIIVLASIYSVNIKIHEKSGKYAEKSKKLLWLQIPTTGRMAIKKTDHLKNRLGLFDQPDFWYGGS